MPVTIYRKDTGQPLTLEHMVDARIGVNGGAYTWAPPPKPKEVAPPLPEIKPEPIVAKKEAKPEPVDKDNLNKTDEKDEDKTSSDKKPSRILRK